MHPRTLLKIVAGLSTVLFAGCMVLSFVTGRDREVHFPHVTHIQKEMTCEICHTDAETEDRAGMPDRDVCMTCHEAKPDKPAKEFEKKLTEDKELKFVLQNKPGDLKFSHKGHIAKGYKCVDCHGNVETLKETDESVIAAMDTCIACHQREGKPAECATCHTKLRNDAKPESHDASFEVLHGRDVRGNEAFVEKSKCLVCHGPSSAQSCERCHAENPPSSHNEFWRRKGHGITASMDREACIVCHREDSCIRCHSNVTPSTHTGAWGGTFAGHCFSCHEPLQANSCSACHQSTPSHALAPSRPPAPHPGPTADCRACHLPNLLIHADNGQNCTTCHH